MPLRVNGKHWGRFRVGYQSLVEKRLFDDIAKHRPSNPLVISGDLHTFYAAELKRDFDRATSVTNPAIATEFCGISITSSSRPQARTDQHVSHNPHIKYGRSDRRGFVMVEVAPTKTFARLMGLDNVRIENLGDYNAGVIRSYRWHAWS